jgi:YNFM family putative membrane transporter
VECGFGVIDIASRVTDDPAPASTNQMAESSRIPVRPLVLLATAGFASTAATRVADPLIPQLVAEFGTTAGAASIVATAFTVSYGLTQIACGPLGDRFGRYRMVVVATLLSAFAAGATALVGSLTMLALARFISGATMGAIIPLAIAWLGDVVPYDQRQPVLARFLSGQISGIVFGQIFGGVFGDTLGWRGIFVLFAALYLVVTALLFNELRSPRVRDARSGGHSGGTIARYIAVLRLKVAQRLLTITMVEGFLFFGALVYFGAALHERFGLRYVVVGLYLACFGLGGLLYTLAVKLWVRLGQRGLVLAGGTMLFLAFNLAAVAPVPWLFAPVLTACGCGFYMMHNTLQVHVTQMAPGARGLAISLFAFCFFLAQSAGVATMGRLVDTIGYAPVFVVSGWLLLALSLVFRAYLGKQGG